MHTEESAAALRGEERLERESERKSGRKNDAGLTSSELRLPLCVVHSKDESVERPKGTMKESSATYGLIELEYKKRQEE